MALFGFRRTNRPEEAERRRIANWAREAGGLSAQAVVKVNEIVCPDPACPGLETVILLMAPGAPTLARKIARPLAEVTREDVAGALNTPAAG